jgi:hypothetical protein
MPVYVDLLACLFSLHEEPSQAATTLYCPPRNDVQARAQVYIPPCFSFSDWYRYNTDTEEGVCPFYLAWSLRMTRFVLA